MNYIKDLSKLLEWLCKHPGGREMLLLHAGRECTHTFDSYHPFSDKSAHILQKYEIGYVVGGSEFPTYLPDTGFYKECQRRVTEYFAKNQMNPKLCVPAVARVLSIFPVGLLSYFLMTGYVTSNVIVMLIGSMLHGCCVAIPLMHLVHVRFLERASCLRW